MTTQLAHEPNGRLAITNGRIVLPDRIVEGRAVVVEGSRIAGLAAQGEIGPDVARIDVGGRYVTPGLIDIHTHGALGHTFDEATPEVWETITDENARRGVTSLLATLAALGSIDDICARLDFCRDWMAAPRPGPRPGPHSRPGHGPRPGAQVLGAHLESPYIAPAQAGGVNRHGLRVPADGSPAPLLAYGGVLRIFVLAPELPGALDLVAALDRAGIIPAAGHSLGRASDVTAAMARGLRHMTHIWSGQSSVVRDGPWRVPGLLEASLVFEGLTVEMICDNRHLPPTLMKLAYKAIGPDRLCAISDATSGAGLPEGSRFRIGPLDYEVRDGVAMLPEDPTTFAGSSTLLNQMVPILVEKAGVPLPEAVRMVTLTPAKIIGCADRKGSLEPGKDADIAVFDEDFTAWRVMIAGQLALC